MEKEKDYLKQKFVVQPGDHDLGVKMPLSLVEMKRLYNAILAIPDWEQYDPYVLLIEKLWYYITELD